MIACVLPGSSSADHTLNTLRLFLNIISIIKYFFYVYRYADRLKEKAG